MTDVQVIMMPEVGRQPLNVPNKAYHGDTIIEMSNDVFHHYIYDSKALMWIHLGGVISLFHPSIVALIPEPDSLEDAYDRAMGVIG